MSDRDELLLPDDPADPTGPFFKRGDIVRTSFEPARGRTKHCWGISIFGVILADVPEDQYRVEVKTFTHPKLAKEWAEKYLAGEDVFDPGYDLHLWVRQWGVELVEASRL